MSTVNTKLVYRLTSFTVTKPGKYKVGAELAFYYALLLFLTSSYYELRSTGPGNPVKAYMKSL